MRSSPIIVFWYLSVMARLSIGAYCDKTQLRMRPQFIIKQAGDLAEEMPDAIERAVEAAMPSLPHSAQDLGVRLKRFVLTTTKKTAARPAE
ncbi:MAG: hypothetical protein ACRESV_09440 [Nevskiales bacterium]